jgi:hypothetical protein
MAFAELRQEPLASPWTRLCDGLGVQLNGRGHGAMRLTEAFQTATRDAIKAALDGGKLELYSTGRPPQADHKVTRSGLLATFTFASPAFGDDPVAGEDAATPAFVQNPVTVAGIGTPSFARAFAADGRVVADFSVGPGRNEIGLSEISATVGFPLAVTRFRITLPAETVEFAKTEFGHVFVTNTDDPWRRLSVRG